MARATNRPRALTAHPDVTPDMDRTAFWHYLTFIVAPAPLTLFKGIFKLPAAYVLTIDHCGEATARQYWDCVPDASKTLARKFDETVMLSVRLGVDPKHADQMVRGAVALPHGVGMTVRVAVFAKGDNFIEIRAVALGPSCEEER